MSFRENVRQSLSEKYNSNNIVLAARANTLLYSILRNLEKGSYVIVPSIMCLSPVLIIQSLGLNPLFVDVESETGLICKKDFQEKIEKYNVSAAVLVHLYGRKIEISDFRKIVQGKDIILIEDAAQALPSSDYQTEADYLLLSFGHSKVIDTKFGGALVAKNQNDYIKVDEYIKSIKITYEQVKHLGVDYSKKYYEIWNQRKQNKEITKQYSEFFKDFSDLYLLNDDHVNWEQISNYLDKESELFNLRNDNFNLYQESLIDIPLTIIKPTSQWPLWRLSCLVDDKRDELVDFLRDENIDVSTWYPNLDEFYNEAQNCPKAEVFSNRVVNFWVNYTDREKTLSVIRGIKAFF